MRWAEVRVRSTAEAEEAVSAILTSIAGGVSISNDLATVSCWIPLDDRLEERLEQVRLQVSVLDSALLGAATPDITVTPAGDADWLTAWRENFRPFTAAGRFWVRPPWEEAPGALQTGHVELILDPGMAFGTGQHPTTEMMLSFLAQHSPADCSVLDLGAGSAVLAIAAAKLGAMRVVAIEIDPVAEENARRNISLNDVEGVVEYKVEDARKSGLESAGFDIVLMNIVADAIIGLSGVARMALKPQGLLACSGIIDVRVDEVRAHLEREGFQVEDISASREWRAIVCRKV